MTEEENRRFDRIESMVGKIFDLLEGPKGLVTKAALQEQKLDNLPSPNSLKGYAFVGGGLTLFMGFLGYTIIRIFSSGGKP